MAKFEAGNDPANHTVAEVIEFLKGDEVTGDEYDRVVQAEREGKNRVGIMSGSGEETPATNEPEAPTPPPAPEVEPDPEIDPNDPQAVHDAAVGKLNRAQQGALAVDSREGGYPAQVFTPEEAMQEAVRRARAWKTQVPAADES